MDVRPVCCEPCEVLRLCRPQRNCCLECHFSYEEQIAFPYLPPDIQRSLSLEHNMLQANGFPTAAVEAHAKREEEIFRRYCPKRVCDMIERDHEAHGHGQLVSREQVAQTLTQGSSAPYSPLWAAVGR
jgi:hypothetical protein